MYEQFNGSQLIWEVCHHSLNGMDGYQQSLRNQGFSISTQNVFGNWSAANFLDEPEIYDGQYGYVGDELPTFFSFRTHSSFPTNGSGSVKDWATDYVRLLSLPLGAPKVTFDGDNAHEFRVKLLAIDSVKPTRVKEMNLDADSDGVVKFPAAYGYELVEISISSVTTIGAGSYNYWIESTPVVQPDPVGPVEGPSQPSKALIH